MVRTQQLQQAISDCWKNCGTIQMRSLFENKVCKTRLVQNCPPPPPPPPHLNFANIIGQNLGGIQANSGKDSGFFFFFLSKYFVTSVNLVNLYSCRILCTLSLCGNRRTEKFWRVGKKKNARVQKFLWFGIWDWIFTLKFGKLSFAYCYMYLWDCCKVDYQLVFVWKLVYFCLCERFCVKK